MKISTLIIIFLTLLSLNAKTVRKFTDYELAENDSLQANVKIFTGNAVINGYLDGNLDVYSGDIEISETGTVTGNAKAYAGKVYNKSKVDENSSYYVVDELKSLVLGEDRFYDRDKDKNGELEVKLGGRYSLIKVLDDNDDGKSFYYHNSVIQKDFFTYSSVEGVYLGLASDIQLITTDYADFNFYGSIGYGFKSEDWQYYTDERLSFFDNIFSIGASQYSGVSSEDQWKISPDMNSVSALFIHEDFYNYYHTEGFGFYTGAIYDIKTDNTETQFGIKAGYYEDRITERHRVNDYALFTNDKHFRQVSFYDGNLADEGKIKEMMYAFQVISKMENLNSIIDISTSYEKTLDDLEQDFEFQKMTASMFFETQFTDILTFSNKLRIESCSYLDPTDPHTVPNFKYTTLGGNGTLPGYKFNEFFGNRALLNRSIIGFAAVKEIDIRAIFDFGEAFEYAPDSEKENIMDGLNKFSVNTLKSSFGVGVGLGDKFLFSIHKRLDSDKDPYQLQFSVIYDY